MLGTIISYNWAQVLEDCNCFKLLSMYVTLCVDAIGVVCHQLGLLGTASPCCRLWRLFRGAQPILPVFLPLLLSHHITKWMLVIVLPPLLTEPLWSSKTVMILSRNLLKRVGESRHPCWTATVVWNQSHILPLRTALVVLSWRCLTIRIWLALMLFFFIVAHKAACETLLKAFLKSMKTGYRSCWCWRCFSKRILKLKICSVVLHTGLQPLVHWSDLPVRCIHEDVSDRNTMTTIFLNQQFLL